MNVPCLLCGKNLSSFHVFDKKAVVNKPIARPAADHTVTMAVAWCPECRHISSAFDDHASRASMTKEIYGETYAGYVPTGLSPTQLRYTTFVADWLATTIRQRGRMVEIGAHDGFFLSLMRDRGFDCEGVEPSPFAENAITKYGLSIRKEFFRAGLYEPQSVDVMVLRHIVEHLTDPVPMLQAAWEAVKPGGMMYVEVPDSLGSLQTMFYPEFHVDHISYFTPASLEKILELCGVSTILHRESFSAYMQFPFQMALCRKDAGSARRTPSSWFMDFRMHQVLEEFPRRFREKYLPRLHALKSAHPLAVWGTGSIGHQFAIDAGWSHDDVVYVDPNPANQGKFLSIAGHEIHPPKAIDEKNCDTILIASGWEEDVRKQIDATVKKPVRVLSFHDLIC